MKRSKIYPTAVLILLFALSLHAQPEVPVEDWKGKTVMFIGAHPDDDALAHGTLAMLRDNGNKVVVVIITSGNVGTKDPNVSMNQLARIRRDEELGALSELGISAEHYINLGYTDGMLELENKKEVIEKLVRLIRTYKPEVVIAFDPGKGKVRWHKADHRAASLLAVDACRAAEWPLLYQGQIIHEGLDFHQVSEYLLIDGFDEDYNTFVDATDYKEQKLNASMHYVSQYTSGNYNYQGAELSESEASAFRKRLEKRFVNENGKVIEKLRYYKGIPDGIGR